MKIGMISDTHGDKEAWQRALSVFEGVELVIHTGDILNPGPYNPIKESFDPLNLAKGLNQAPFPLIFAKGNCDSEVDALALDYPILSPYTFIYLPTVSILAIHGHQHGTSELFGLAKRYRVSLIVHGHTHIPAIEKKDQFVIVNPGSPSLPKNNSLPTVAILEANTLRIYEIESGQIVQEERIAG
jgi:hypothetical protein